VVWSACGKVLCLWSVNSGTFLGKIGHDKELEGDGGSNAGDGAWEEPPPRSSVAEDIGKLRIHSAKVCFDSDRNPTFRPSPNPNPKLSPNPTVYRLTRVVTPLPGLVTATEQPNLEPLLPNTAM